jgi:hypothetical protein
MINQEKLIIETIKQIDKISDENLVHYLKCISGKTLKKEKDMYKPLIVAIEKERKKRGAKLIKEQNLEEQAEQELLELEEETERLNKANEQKDNEY